MHGPLTLLVGPASARLGDEVCAALQTTPARYTRRRFPDGETLINLDESVRGRDVFLLQATGPPAELHLMELLLLADACRRGGAGRLTAVIPYFAYARQDRRTDREALGGRVAANIVTAGRFDRVMLIDAHSPAIEGWFDMPIEHLTAVPLLARAASESLGHNPVVIAPDLGAVRLARAYAKLLEAPLALVHKTRLGGDEVKAHQVVGDVNGRSPLIVDDILSTGATIRAAIGAVHATKGAEPCVVVVTHALFAGPARETLRGLPVARLIATNTLPFDGPPVPNLQVVSAGPLIATAIERAHRGESLADLRSAI